MLQERRLAVGVAHRSIAVGLDPGDVTRQTRPFAECRDQHGINIVKPLAKGGQITSGHRAFIASTSAWPMSAGLFTTRTPASVSAAIFSAAVPLPPAMIAPA